MSTLKVLDADFSAWKCSACGKTLVPKAVELEYLESVFSVELPACPECDLVLIPEDLALGKMAEVESLLEDK
ncbi:DVU_1557 family redox protein [Maridesulfovibrio frigidus]|uniref:DVU_1557 family redox protein n=1 Tax=Maridesulfovibrio frigidus TaxID=340956 RepID=UPI0004E11CBF|nr:CLJU_RS11820 family redox protein [Maridesulfovibrio frigidus]